MPMTTWRDFLEREVRPQADAWDREQRIPREVLAALGTHGLLATQIAPEHGGRPLDAVALVEVLEAMGGASMSLLSVVTVHAMCAQAIGRWGEPELQRAWLPAMATGAKFGALALTEPNVGSDARNVETQLADQGDRWAITGTKRWISTAQFADVFVVFGQAPEGPTAVLVPRDAAGLTVRPIDGMLGFRAAQLGEVVLENVVVPKTATLGRPGAGVSHVAGTALDLGRFCVACGCTGLMQACLRASVDYARARRQFGVVLREHQLIQAMLAEMTTAHKAAQALCRHAAKLRAESHPDSIGASTIAKYFASTAASRVADSAVQIHGANGCGPEYPVQRYYRDARIGEIIEGSNQVQQLLIAHQAVHEYATRRRRGA